MMNGTKSCCVVYYEKTPSHCDVKRMVLPSIIVAVSETLCPSLLREKMKSGILIAFTQVVAENDRYSFYVCMYVCMYTDDINYANKTLRLCMHVYMYCLCACIVVYACFYPGMNVCIYVCSIYDNKSVLNIPIIIYSHSLNSSSTLAENLERKSSILANFFSPMILRQPDLFIRILREEFFPAGSNELVDIYDTCCPDFYPANACMGVGLNILKPKFEKVFLVISTNNKSHSLPYPNMTYCKSFRYFLRFCIVLQYVLS